MSNLDKLNTYFEQFPGVGGRQARRFSFHILTLPKADVTEIARLITSLQDNVTECHSCHRFFSQNGKATECNICSDPNRDTTELLVVERDSDIIPIERSGVYNGLYFVLGGKVPLLESKEANKLRSGALRAIVQDRVKNGLKEIVLAFAVNPDGENTTRYIEKLLQTEVEENKLTVSQLGRGLSTGSELEYADPETIKSAWKNRG